MDGHIKFMFKEKALLNTQRLICNNDIENFYIEIEGMDQSKTNLPHYSNFSKDINKDLLMQIHVTGVRYSCEKRSISHFVIQKPLQTNGNYAKGCRI